MNELNCYLSEIARYPLLTAEQEQQLATSTPRRKLVHSFWPILPVAFRDWTVFE
ncbi:sigma-70 factor domain-containing protein [Thermodesulfobacteriota bacterium]